MSQTPNRHADLIIGLSLGAIMVAWSGPTLLEGLPALLFIGILALLGLDSWGPAWYSTNRWLRSPGILALTAPIYVLVCLNLTYYPQWPTLMLGAAGALLLKEALTHPGWAGFKDSRSRGKSESSLPPVSPAVSSPKRVIGALILSGLFLLTPEATLPGWLVALWIVAMTVLALNLTALSLPPSLKRSRSAAAIGLVYAVVGVFGLSFTFAGCILGVAVFLILKDLFLAGELREVDPRLIWYGGTARRTVFVGVLLASMGLNAVWDTTWMSHSYTTERESGGLLYRTHHAAQTFEGENNAYGQGVGTIPALCLCVALLSTLWLEPKTGKASYRGLPLLFGGGLLGWSILKLTALSRETDQYLKEGYGVGWANAGPFFFALGSLLIAVGGLWFLVASKAPVSEENSPQGEKNHT